MKHPEKDKQNAMDPSITFHDDLMNGESQIDIVSWMTLVSYLRLDSSHDWAVDYEEWEKGKKSGLIPNDFSTKDFHTLAGDRDCNHKCESIPFYRYLAAWDFHALDKYDINNSPDGLITLAEIQLQVKQDMTRAQKRAFSEHMNRVEDLFLLFDLDEDQSWDIHDMMAFAVWR